MRTMVAVQQSVGTRLVRGKATIGVLVDLKRAFDSADHAMIEVKLRERGVHGRLLRNTMDKFANRTVGVKATTSVGTVMSESIRDRGRGATQGGVDSMELFDLLIDDIDAFLADEGFAGETDRPRAQHTGPEARERRKGLALSEVTAVKTSN